MRGALLACLVAVLSPGLGARPAERGGSSELGATHVKSIKCLDPDTGARFAPLGVGFDLGGRLFVIDSDDSRLFVLPDSLTSPGFFADCPADTGRCQLVDLVADAGLLYVSDREGGTIAVLDAKGYLMARCEVGPGVGGLGLGPAGQVYAAMTVSGSIVAVDVLGEKSLVTCPISDSAGASYPLDCLVLGPDRVLVTDAASKQVLVLSPLGKVLGSLEGFRFESPFGLARWLDHAVLVSDSDLGVVAAFDLGGRFVSSFGEGHLKTPAFVAARDDGILCIADVGKMTLEVFKLDAPAEK